MVTRLASQPIRAILQLQTLKILLLSRVLKLKQISLTVETGLKKMPMEWQCVQTASSLIGVFAVCLGIVAK